MPMKLNSSGKLTKYNDLIYKIGIKVKKISNKPFKSKEKINTICGYMKHPVTNRLCYVFLEDNSYVETFMCTEAK